MAQGASERLSEAEARPAPRPAATGARASGRGAAVPIVDIAAGGMVWHARADEAGRFRDWLAAHFPGILKDEICLLKKDRGRRVAVAEGLVIKATLRRRGRSRLRFALRASTSRRDFAVGDRLIAGGVPLPRPVAWATLRRGGLRVADYIVTERIADSRKLTSILKAARDSECLRRPVLDGLGELLALFHRNGYSNRDLKDGNVLAVERPALRLWAVDLDGVRRACWRVGGLKRDFRAVLRSLGLHGWATAADKAALLEAYNARVPARLRLRRLPPFGRESGGRGEAAGDPA